MDEAQGGGGKGKEGLGWYISIAVGVGPWVGIQIYVV